MSWIWIWIFFKTQNNCFGGPSVLLSYRCRGRISVVNISHRSLTLLFLLSPLWMSLCETLQPWTSVWNWKSLSLSVFSIQCLFFLDIKKTIYDAKYKFFLSPAFMYMDYDLETFRDKCTFKPKLHFILHNNNKKKQTLKRSLKAMGGKSCLGNQLDLMPCNKITTLVGLSRRLWPMISSHAFFWFSIWFQNDRK